MKAKLITLACYDEENKDITRIESNILTEKKINEFIKDKKVVCMTKQDDGFLIVYE